MPHHRPDALRSRIRTRTTALVAGVLLASPLVMLVTALPAQAADQTATVTAGSITLPYGTDPGLFNLDEFATYSIDESLLTTPATCTTSATATSPIGTYPMTCSGAVAGGYSFTYVPGVLTIDQAKITVRGTGSKAYGAPYAGLDVAYTGFVNGDTVESTVTTPATCQVSGGIDGTSVVSSYQTTCTGAATTNPNYQFTYPLGVTSYRVTRVPLTIIARPVQSALYPNGNNGHYTVNFDYVGLTGGDSRTDVRPTCTTSVTYKSTPGLYPDAATCSGASDNNYSPFTYVAADIAVKPLLTLVGPGAQTVAYGSPTPRYPVTYSGFIDGDDESDLTTPASCVGSSGPTSVIGSSYLVNCGGAASDKYVIREVAYPLAVVAAQLTVTANAPTTAYGDAPTTVTPTYSGFRSGDDASVITTPATCSSTAGTGAGTYVKAATCSGAVAAGYTIVYAPADVVVSKRPLTVTPVPYNAVYGNPGSDPLPGYTGFIPGDTVSNSVLTTALCSSNTDATTPAGTHDQTSTCVGGGANNYEFTYAKGSVIISKRPLTITAPSVTKAYGAPVPPLPAPTYTGFAPGEGVADLTTPAACGTLANASTPVAGTPQKVTCSNASSPNYSFTYLAGSVIVTPVPVTIKAVPHVSSDNHVTVTADVSGLVNGDDASGSIVCGSTVNQNSSPGTYPGAATCHGFGNSNYDVTFVPAAVTIRPTLTITADQIVKKYGANPPAVYSPVYVGFVDGDDAGDLDTPATCTSDATAQDAAQTSHRITCSGAATAKYYLVYNNTKAVVVTKAPVVVTAVAAPTTYGSPVTVTPSYAGLVLGETETDLTTKASCSSSAPAEVGTYPGAATCSGASSSNYSFTYVAGPVEITKRTVTITASDGTGTYGSAALTITPSYSGFAPGDNEANSLGGTPTCASNTDASTLPGTYPGTSSCSGATSPNYTIAYAKGTMVIARKTLEVTAPSPSRVYGEANPTLPPSYTGFVNGQGIGDLPTPPTCTTTATAASPVASGYPVTCSGGSSATYTFHFNDGALSVTKKLLTITASNAQPTYGDNPVPVITASYAGFVNGDDADDLATKPTCASNITPTTAAGVYLGITTCGSAASANYSFGYAPGNITVTKAPVDVIASAGTQVYGATVKPVITASFSGLRNGDPSSVLGTHIACVSNVNATTPAGTYVTKSICSGAVAANYQPNYVTGVVIVTKAPAVITAGPTTSVWGTAPPVPTATFTDLKNGETRAVLTTQPTCTAGVTAATDAGSHPSTTSCSGAVAANYAFTYVKGTATVTKANLVITGSPISVKKSAYAGKMTFSAKVTNSVGGLPIAGVPVNFATTSVLLYTLTCTGVTNAQGVATCTNANGNLLLLKLPGSFTAKAVGTNNYNAGSGTGKITYN